MRDHVFLVGSMASGKSSVGVLLAAELGRRFIDNDTLLEAATGKRAEEIFSADGRAELHAKENAAVEEAISTNPPSVLALPAGSIEDEPLCSLASSSGTVVFLRAKHATLAARLEHDERRPLSGGASELSALDEQRRRHYEELADLVVDVDELTPIALAKLIALQLRRVVKVALGTRSYDVLVGPGTRLQLAMLLPKAAKRAVVVKSPGVPIDLDLPIEHTTLFVENGEAAKTMSTVESLCRSWSRSGLTRDDVVIGLGGGAVSDVAGFAAACYHRGVAVVHVATTLLGQIDAAIGGKTGVNLPEGKNLVGAFHQPAGVVCDTDVLYSLPDREWASGLGEMAKYAFLGVEDLETLPLVDQVARCVALKAQIVAEDERESDRRMILNYGHTLAHALEAEGFNRSAGLDIRHGEAVAIGLSYAARLARRLGRIDDARVARHDEVLAAYGLSGALPKHLAHDEIVEAMRRDKKATKGLTFVLDGSNGVEPVRDVSPAAVLATLAEHEADSANLERKFVRK